MMLKHVASSEPIIRHAASVARQVFELIEAVEMPDRDLRHGSGFGQPEVDRESASAVRPCFQAAPMRHAAAIRAEMKADRIAADIGIGRTADIDILALVTVDPQTAVAAADSAVARCRRLGHALEPPFDRAAVTGTLDHSQRRTELLYSRYSAPNFRSR